MSTPSHPFITSGDHGEDAPASAAPGPPAHATTVTSTTITSTTVKVTSVEAPPVVPPSSSLPFSPIPSGTEPLPSSFNDNNPFTPVATPSSTEEIQDISSAPLGNNVFSSTGTDTFSVAAVTLPDSLLPVPSSSSEFAGMVVSTMISSRTDSLGAVHTFTEVTTIASFKAVPTNKHVKGSDTKSTSGSSTPNVGVIIAAVMGGLAVCAVALLLIYWCRRRRRSSSRIPTWGQRFDWAMKHQPHMRLNPDPYIIANRATIASFGNSEENTTTARPFYGQESTDSLALAPISTKTPRVQFAAPPTDGNGLDVEGKVRPRNREGVVQTERPPTYYTNITGIATIATNLPQYSIYDPSPVSERSGLPDTPTSSVPSSPLYGREKLRRSAASRYPLTPIGEKF